MTEKVVLNKKDAEIISDYLGKLASRLESEKNELRKSDKGIPESMTRIYIKMIVEIDELRQKLKEYEWGD